MKDRISKRIKLKIRRTKSSRSESLSERQAIIRREDIREAEQSTSRSKIMQTLARFI